MTAGLLLGLVLAAGAQPRALLFAPDPAALDWAAFRALVGSSGARFTAALPPSEVPEPERAWLREAAAAGRLELALRLPGDPLLPLLSDARPSALAERLAVERAVSRAAFGAVPRGFVAAGALLDAPALRRLAATGLAWTAAGEGAYSRPWDAEGLLAAPLRAAVSTESARPPAPGEPPGAAVDETAVLEPGTGLALLRALLESRGVEWTTVSDAVSAAEPFGVAPASWPAWAGAEGWADEEDAGRYARAARAVERYQNSGAASLRRLESAAAALDRAAAARSYRAGAVPDLAPVYRALGEAAPAGEGPGRVTASALPRGVAFSAEPASDAPGMPVALRAQRSAAGVEVAVSLASAAAGRSLEVYIDVNGLAGRGSTRLLGGRRPLIASRDAWEFAIVFEAGRAALWRVGAPAAHLEDLEAPEGTGPAELRVTIPARRLRGNPASWGWLVVTDDGALGASSEVMPEEGAPPLLRAARLRVSVVE